MNPENYIGLWDEIADDYDAKMGDDGNSFHRELIRPATLRLLNPQPNERILDAACGNGIFTCYMAAMEVEVVAFDYSSKWLHMRKNIARLLLIMCQFRWQTQLSMISF